MGEGVRENMGGRWHMTFCIILKTLNFAYFELRSRHGLSEMSREL